MLESPEFRTAIHRRALFRGAAAGLGSLALNSLLEPRAFGAAAGTHFAPRAKRVIFMHMTGAPSQLELFDYKPELQRFDRQLCPDDFFKGKRFAFLRGHPKLLGTRYQ